MKIIETTIQDKKDQYNAMNTNMSLKDIAGNTVELHGYVIYTSTEEKDDGTVEEKTITAIKTGENEFAGTVSPNVADQVRQLHELFGDEKIAVEIEKLKSKNDRDFLSLKLV